MILCGLSVNFVFRKGMTMAIIHKKILAKYFNQILLGEKKFELRLADFKVEKGDTLSLIEIDDVSKKETGRMLDVDVSYVLKTKDCRFWSEKDINEYGFQIIQFNVHKGE